MSALPGASGNHRSIIIRFRINRRFQSRKLNIYRYILNDFSPFACLYFSFDYGKVIVPFKIFGIHKYLVCIQGFIKLIILQKIKNFIG